MTLEEKNPDFHRHLKSVLQELAGLIREARHMSVSPYIHGRLCDAQGDVYAAITDTKYEQLQSYQEKAL